MSTAISDTSVVIRPVRKGDLSKLAAFYEGLSTDSLYARFMSCGAGVNKAQLVRFCAAGVGGHYGFVAVLGGRIVGHATLDAGGGVAEPGIAVADDLQGKGIHIGPRLLAKLVAVSRANNHPTWQISHLSTNWRIREILVVQLTPIGNPDRDGEWTDQKWRLNDEVAA